MTEEVLWMGMAHCPSDDCHFTVKVEADDEGDLDLAALAAFESHVDRVHPGSALSLSGYSRHDEGRPRHRLN